MPFPVVVTADGSRASATIVARQRYDDRRADSWRAGLGVRPATAAEEAVDRFDPRVLAGLVGTAVVAGSVIVLLRLRRRALQVR